MLLREHVHEKERPVRSVVPFIFGAIPEEVRVGEEHARPPGFQLCEDGKPSAVFCDNGLDALGEHVPNLGSEGMHGFYM